MDYTITLAGTATAVITKTVTAPLDRMKILYQIQDIRTPGKYGNSIPTIKTFIKEEGIKGMDLVTLNTGDVDFANYPTATLIKKWSKNFDESYGGYKTL